MKFLSAGLTFVNVTTVCGALGGIAAHGLSKRVAIFSVIAGLVAALLAYWKTYNPPQGKETEVLDDSAAPASQRYQSTRWLLLAAVFVIAVFVSLTFGYWPTWLRLALPIVATAIVATPASQRYRSTWLWLTVAVFAMFAIRSFCNVLFIDGNELKIQNPNNLGDLSLHLTYINNFANGVPLWPENPIYVFSKLRYPAGIDLFNALLLCLDVGVIRGLVWVGLLASLATCYALYRWGGTFTIAGFLFNGGIAGFQLFRNFQWSDYQGVPFIAWKSLALSMLVTQRGLLYALPVGLLLLYHWRAKFFPRNQGEALATLPSSSPPDGSVTVAAPAPPPLPFWLELTLYATMPLFHLHTFLALSIVLLFLFLFLNTPARKQLALLAVLAFLPATFFTWLITDHFHAGSVLHWNPGWVQNNGDFARPLAAFTQQPATVLPPAAGFVAGLKHFVQFWFINFGITIPLIIGLLAVLASRTWRRRDEPAPMRIRLISILVTLAVLVAAFASAYAYLSLGYSLFVVLAVIPPVAMAVMVPLFAYLLQRNWRQEISLSTPVAFVIPAVALFLFACFVKTAPWEWDNIKLIIWAYLIVLPFVWSEVVSRWAFPIRAIVCVALFGSGFLTLFGGLAAGKTGYGLANREELDAVGVALKKLPADARFAAFPTYNHPVLLQGRKVILGYPGHVWTQGFDYGQDSSKLGTLMNGAPGWKEAARSFHARYLFWGREEKTNYAGSTRPWEQESKLIASGPWGSIYDLESPREIIPTLTPTPTPSPTPTPAPVSVPTSTPPPQN
jgi:hypothetical protein